MLDNFDQAFSVHIPSSAPDHIFSVQIHLIGIRLFPQDIFVLPNQRMRTIHIHIPYYSTKDFLLWNLRSTFLYEGIAMP